MNDLISRKEAIDILYNYKRMLFDGVSDPVIYGVQGAIEVIKTIPCAVSTGEWIPCSERLPDREAEYIVTNRWTGQSGDIYNDVETSFFEHGHWDIRGNVTAWMPMPEPYERGADDE